MKKYGKHYFRRRGQIDKDLDGYNYPDRYAVKPQWPEWAKIAYRKGYGYNCSPETRKTEYFIDGFCNR